MNIVDEIIRQLGVSRDQAEGGLGLILKLVQEKLGTEFSMVSQAIPDAHQFIGKAPGGEPTSGSGLMGMLGGMADKLGLGPLGNLADLVAGFQQLGLNAEAVRKFIDVVMSLLDQSGGPVLKERFAKALAGH